MNHSPPTLVKPTPAARPPARMSLGAVVRGKLKRPMRIVCYGVEKIGKSTFAAGAPSPIFIGAEDGTGELDVTRFPEPHRWQDVLDAVQVLIDDPHDHKTVVLDTLDWAEPLCWRALCERHNKKDIEAFGYGKGYVAALDEWRLLLNKLDALRAKRGMHVILLAHAWIRSFKNPTGDDFDRYELKVHAKAAGMVKEWADVVLFANYETFTVRKGDGPLARSRGVSNGARVLHTLRTAAWDAGNRYGLPETIPLSWDEYADAVERGAPESLETLLARVEELLAQVDDETRGKVRTWLATGTNGKDPLKLSQLADRLRGKVIITSNTNGNEPTNEESKS
jgi:hypothetical protein